MAETSSDAFLSGEGIPVELHDVETELVRLWGPSAERAGGPELENPHVTRMVLANLVVAGHSTSAAELEPVLFEVTALYPCRSIIIRKTDRPERKINAEVSALCQIPAPGSPQICSDRILLLSGPQAADLLPGAVRPLLEANLPFVLWWAEDPRADEALFRDLGAECSRMILDLPDPGTNQAALRLGLDPKINTHTRDAAWFSLTNWRELVAQFFDPPGHLENLALIDSVRIDALSPGPLPRTAAWLAAWLAGQLNWTPIGTPERSTHELKAQFQGPNGPIKVEITTQNSGSALTQAQIQGITLTTANAQGAERFRLERPTPDSSQIHAKINSTSYCTLPRVVNAPEPTRAKRVAAALQASRVDPTFDHALPHLFWLLEG